MANPQNKKQGKNGSVPAGKLWTTLTGVYLIVLVVFLFYLLFAFWPSPSNPAATPPPKEGTQLTDALTDVDILWWTAKISFEKRLIFLVIIAGALGSYVAAAVSFVDYAGNKKLKRSWLWWYYLRPFTGSVLAVMFYMIIKGGLISASFDAQSLSRFGIVGFAGLVGLFSKQAIDKLNEIFNVVFTLRDEDVKKKRGDSLEDGEEPGKENCENLGSSNGESNQIFPFKSPVGLKKIDVEVREILEEEEEKRILKEMGAKSIRHIKNDAGEIEETWIMWKEVDDVSSEGGDARVFHVDKQACKVAFGDGKHGKIPPSGTNNIRAIYTCEETE